MSRIPHSWRWNWRYQKDAVAMLALGYFTFTVLVAAVAFLAINGHQGLAVTVAIIAALFSIQVGQTHALNGRIRRRRESLGDRLPGAPDDR